MAVSQDLEKGHRKLVLEWENLGYAIKDKAILSNISGSVASGEMIAVMGPSGAGKSTLLDILAKRSRPSSGQIRLNGQDNIDTGLLTSYVEQHDALLGVLTVRETLTFSARLSLDPSTSGKLVKERVDSIIAGLGLTEVSNNRIGNPIQRGISGGQKRRVTIGCCLVTLPQILLLDEPTSGLDSRTSREVISAIKRMAVEHGMIVIATIHQPNYETATLFDSLLILARGNTVYSGPVGSLSKYLKDVLDHPVPQHANPTDHALDVVNTEFMSGEGNGEKHIQDLLQKWSEHASHYRAHSDVLETISLLIGGSGNRNTSSGFHRPLHQTWVLVERNTINYSRNLLAYGVRLAMYVGMGVLLATVWVNLAQTSFKINDRLSVHFFSVAFLGFMSVAGIPAFLEERQVFVRERLNGLYGPGPYVLANSLCTAPYLFVCVFLFTIICYWSIGLHPGATAFFRFLGFLFLAVYTAESQSAVVAAIIPIFVAALAIASFLNGFWMCVGGYFIKAVNLPRFWYYWAHFIDYQTYAFDLLVVNDFRGLVFECATGSDGTCQCSFPSSLILQGQCAVSGEDVLNSLGIGGISTKLYAGILLIIMIVFRVLLYLVLVLKKR